MKLSKKKQFCEPPTERQKLTGRCVFFKHAADIESSESCSPELDDAIDRLAFDAVLDRPADASD